MSFFDTLFFYIVLVVFPFLLIAIVKIKSKSELKVLIDISCLLSLFLLLKYTNHDIYYSLIFVNIPLIISFIYKRNVTCVFIAPLTLIYFYILGLNLNYLIIEYFLYYIVYIINESKKNNMHLTFYLFIFIRVIFITVNNLFLSLNIYSLSKILISVFIFYIVTEILCRIINSSIIKHNFNKTENKLKVFNFICELKNPLSVCKGYMQMMDYDNVDKIKRYNNIIKNELDKMLKLMDDFKI